MSTNNNFRERFDDIPLNQWKEAFTSLSEYLTRKLRGRTASGPYSKSALGSPAVEYLSKRAYDMLVNEDCYWPPEVSLVTQLIRNAKREMRRIEDEWQRNEPPSPMQAERQLVMDLRTQASTKEMAYRIAMNTVANEPRLLTFLIIMREDPDRRAIARKMKIPLAEVDALEAELLRRLQA